VTNANITLPIGVKAEMEAQGADVSLKILEASTIPAGP
jgi:hypothetical protein